ncbi:MAG: penicillin acylase family protein, partial [Pseudomonadota bacterium]
VRTITVPYRTGEGMAERTFTTYRTHHGPVVRSEQGRWVSVALMEQPMRALMQSYLRTKAMHLDDYLGIMALHTNSSNNTVFADAEGNIAYLHSNFVPVRNPALDYRLPVDGADPASDWQGLHSIEESPNTINPPTGWLQNTNNWPYSAAGPGASPRYADYPPYMDIGTENPRGVHALDLLSQVEKLSLEGLVTLAYDPALPAFAQLLPPLFKAYAGLDAKDARRAALAAPIAELQAWDRRWATDSVATSLAVFWATPLMREARPQARAARQEVIAYMAQALEPDAYLAALQGAVDRLSEDFGDWRTPWGEINRFQRLTGDISPPYDDEAPSTPVGFVSGRWGSLASFGAAPKPGTARWYGTGGNSFVAVVEFGERVRAVAVTAGGLARDPASPHFNDQGERYAEGRLRPVYFWPDELAEHIERRYRPGQ